ncbi:type 1 glutamine amidotransferase domain-containing protein [Bowmanella denitrificans]|uniref:type 1 glutamine amidotransferase domain-containing protein n=1 Tax=Bowmanella denitrificans TaxID=366582 RepID=UPI001C0F0A06|nr:type 1 glutamine amidotransferase domain-containing protein [Bowmanella denitrificans]
MKTLIVWLMVALSMVASVQAETGTEQRNKILIVLTSHSELGDTGRKTGFWLPELTHPYYEFKQAGFQIDIASPLGGMAPLDDKAFTEADDYHQRFLEDAELMAKVIRTLPLATINPSDYDAVLYSGGSGPMWDFPDNKHISRISASIYEQGGIVSAVCHGTAALVDITLSNGEYLVANKPVAAFTKQEEADIGQLDIIPFLLEEKLQERGATHISGAPWQENVVVEGRLITGQNPASAKKLAVEVIKAIQQTKAI